MNRSQKMRNFREERRASYTALEFVRWRIEKLKEFKREENRFLALIVGITSAAAVGVSLLVALCR